MSLGMGIVFALVVIGSVGFVVYQVRQIRMNKRNIKHWERGEPLEGDAGRWD